MGLLDHQDKMGLLDHQDKMELLGQQVCRQNFMILCTICIAHSSGHPGDAASAGGVSFTRWGRTTCPDTNATQTLYQGTMAGSSFNEAGSAEYLCLHQQPQFLNTTPGVQTYRGYLHGTKYAARDSPPAFSEMFLDDAPCAVCYITTRTAKITIPARTSCPPSWTTEYYGYLMADRHSSNHKTRVPVCIDVNAESAEVGIAEEMVAHCSTS